MDGYTEVELYATQRQHMKGSRRLLVPVGTSETVLVNLAEEHLNDVVEWGFRYVVPMRSEQVDGPVVEVVVEDPASEVGESDFMRGYAAAQRFYRNGGPVMSTASSNATGDDVAEVSNFVADTAAELEVLLERRRDNRVWATALRNLSDGPGY